MRDVRIMTLSGDEVDKRLLLSRGEAVGLYSATAYAGGQILWMSCVTYLFAPVMVLGAVVLAYSVVRIFQVSFGRTV